MSEPTEATSSDNGGLYVPLHCHSYFSLLDGLPSPASIAQKAKALGHGAVALTDHGSCAGLYAFQKACKKAGVKPILGMEAYLVNNVQDHDKDESKRHITLWAKNVVGYKNLITLSTASYVEGFYGKPRIDPKILQKHREGLMAGSACAKGVVMDHVMDGKLDLAEQEASRFKEIFGDDFYMEVMSHTYNPSAKKKEAEFFRAYILTLGIADKLGIKSVITYDSHYCDRADAFSHEVLLAIQTKNTIKNPDRFSFESDDFYMKSSDELAVKCARRLDLMANTLEVAGKVEPDLIKPSSMALPDFPLPPGVESEEQYLKDLIRDGMMNRGIFNRQEYRDRIMMELDVIFKCKFTRYFLVLWDLVSYAKKNQIGIGPGRGSGVASLCLYCLGVTELDPIRWDLLFARFLNPDRVSPPDVDLDFEDVKQEEMFKYVTRKYGKEHVVRIGTYGTLKSKDVIRRVGKALDVGGDWEDSDKKGPWKSGKKTLAIVDEICKSMPKYFSDADDEEEEEDDRTDLQKLMESDEMKYYVDKYPELFRIALKMEGTKSTAGLHAAGIIISRDVVADLAPLRIKDDVVCTQFDMKEVDELGLLSSTSSG
jgi:DNA polymerase-3 subunit alpha